MEKFVTGDIIVVAFPFSDLSSTRKRPALVLSNLEGEDIVYCNLRNNFYNKRGYLQGSIGK